MQQEQPKQEAPKTYRELQREAEERTARRGGFVPKIVRTSPASGLAFLQGSSTVYRLEGRDERITRRRVTPKLRSKDARRLRHRCLKHAEAANAWYGQRLASETGEPPQAAATEGTRP